MSADLAVATLATVHTHPPAELLQMATTLVSLHLSAATQVHPALPQSQDWRRDVFTLHEVAQHDRIEDCWLVIYDRVYDVTSFLATVSGCKYMKKGFLKTISTSPSIPVDSMLCWSMPAVTPAWRFEGAATRTRPSSCCGRIRSESCRKTSGYSDVRESCG